MTYQCAVRTHVGCRRTSNEDAVLARPELGVWAVADGMGGHEAGEVASAMVVEALGGLDPGLTVAARTNAATRALHQTNQALIQLAAEKGGGRSIGSTVVAFFADGRAFICLWAGDSRAYRARGHSLEQLTRDHSLVQELVDLGELDPAAAANHPNANVITRAVGASPSLEIDSVGGDVAPGDAFLLASDGLTRLLTDAELLAGLQAADLEPAADEMLQMCLERGAPDNVSLVLVRRA
ncbi:MAG TPA: protein phosphatase 2C domain-containing protein [Caulobacteraceae bacterium]|nr:protein phosphatase 2C domain-containing protein [Caulobacteraceae bacterium]